MHFFVQILITVSCTCSRIVKSEFFVSWFVKSKIYYLDFVTRPPLAPLLLYWPYHFSVYRFSWIAAPNYGKSENHCIFWHFTFWHFVYFIFRVVARWVHLISFLTCNIAVFPPLCTSSVLSLSFMKWQINFQRRYGTHLDHLVFKLVVTTVLVVSVDMVIETTQAGCVHCTSVFTVHNPTESWLGSVKSTRY